MESIDRLRRWADALRCAWVNQGDGTITLTTGCDMPPRVDSVSLCDHVNGILDDIEREVDGEYVKLPVDADGVPVRLGDDVKPFGYEPGTVASIEFRDDGNTFVGVLPYGWDVPTVYNAIEVRHYHESTVEDVLRKFAEGLGVPVADSYVAATAAKLRLAGDE